MNVPGGYFKEVEELKSRGFPEEECRALMARWRWPKGFWCPRCGSNDFTYREENDIRQCRACKSQKSTSAGTTLHGQHAGYQVWFSVAYLVVVDPRFSMAVLSRELGLSMEEIQVKARKLRESLESVEGIRPRLDKYRAFRAALGIPTRSNVTNIGRPRKDPTPGHLRLGRKRYLVAR